MDFNFDTGTIFGGIQTIDTSTLPPLGGTANVLTIAGPGAVLMPNGTTLQRPTGAAGMLRYSSTLTAMEYHDGTNWTSLSVGGGTVTSVATAVTGTGISISGGPITTTGTLTFQLGSELQGLNALASTGLVTRTAANTYIGRTIAGTAGNIAVSDGDGVLANPAINLAAITQSTSNNFVKVTLDGFGRVTGNTAVGTSDITNLVDGTYVNISGDTMATNANLTFVGTGTVNGLPLPTGGSDAANKAYVDAVAAGVTPHQPTQAATTDELATLTGGSVTYANGVAGVGATLTLGTALTTLDGYPLVNGNRVLIKNEATASHNGIYTWATGGTVLTRASDYDTTSEITGGSYVFNQFGSVYPNTGFVESNTVTTIGADPIVFIQFSGAGTYTAGAGLNLVGTVFSLTTPVATTLGGTGSVAAPTAGQLLIGATGGSFVPAFLSAGTAIGITNASGSVTVNNTGVTSIAGTTNQITASASTGGVTLSLPNAVTVNSSLTVSGLTAQSFLYSGVSGLLTSTTAPTDGQLLIGSTGLAPVAATLTAGTNISITNTAGAITIANTGGTVISVDVSGGTTGLTFSGGPVTTTGTITMAGTLAPANGGSGLTALGTANQVLGVNAAGTAAEYKTITAGTGMGVSNAAGSITLNNTGVTSVGLTDGSTTPIYTISTSPVTTTGSLTFSLSTQTANTVFAGPVSGGATQPGFRGLVLSDLSGALQLYKESATTPTAPVATGTNSVALGSASTATATGSFAVGAGTDARIFGQKAYANGSFATAGDAQHGVYVLRTITTNATANVALFLDGAATQLVLPDNSLFTFDIIVAARRTDAVGGGAGYRFVGIAKKDTTSGSVTFVGTPSKTILGETNTPWDATVSVDTGTGAIVVAVKGEAAKTIRWVATVLTTEVTN